MSYPKQFNLMVDSGSGTTLSGDYNCFMRSSAGTFTLPALSTVQDGAQVYLKHSGAAGSVVFVPSGSDTISGGSSANVTLTSAGAGAGQGASIVASKQGSATWIVLVKPN